MSSGLITRILERLSAVSGEKPRIFEEEEVDENVMLDELDMSRKQSS